MIRKICQTLNKTFIGNTKIFQSLVKRLINRKVI